MKKQYLKMDVYEAFKYRMDFLIREFENIYISFSGGKDSGLLFHMVIKYIRDKGYSKTIGVFHQDFEAQYNATTEYVELMFEKYLNLIDPYWVCLPMAAKTALSSYQMFWYPWDDKKENSWVRKMPEKKYVINIKKNPFYLYRYKMHQEDLYNQFGRWYKEINENKKTVCILGTRADESLHRYSGFLNKKHGYKGECWITKKFKDVWNASPLYDWTISDIWKAYYKFGYEYNKLYDLYYKAGLKPGQMRVASPFNEYAKESLNLYRVLEPKTWTKLVGRVNGANFTAIYGKTKAMGYRNITLPEGYTWKSYTYFLLNTLPLRVRKNYIKKFNTSIRFWHTVGGGLSEETIKELIDKGYNIRRNGISNYTKDKKSKIIFLGKIPDNTDDIKTSKDIPSWKRMCFCILKNDHICRFMGFGLSREEQSKIKLMKEKYSVLGGIE